VADTLALVAGASRSQTYAMLARLRDLVPTLVGSPGRPVSQPARPDQRMRVLVALRDYLMAHPGAVSGTDRRTYTDDFRHFVVDLVKPGEPGEGLSVEQLAWACAVPLGTLKDWMRSTEPQAAPSPPANDPPDQDLIRDIHVRVIVTMWRSWQGTFLAFCQMLRQEQRLPHGPTFIGNVLQSLGLRERRRRTPVEAPWSSRTFRTFFPGLQWLGDGTALAVRWLHQVFVFNLEVFNDPAADATMGFALSKAEDAAALRQAYEMGRDETAGGVPPISTTLDNKECNHCSAAQEALADTTVLRATKGRGQAKAPLEGAFGLFKQSLPPLVITGDTPEEMAQCVATLVATAWFRGRNGKPRKRLGGLTPAQAYANAKPTPEEIERARAWFRELQRRQERARLTREARRDPVRRELLRKGLEELGIPDPGGRLAVSLACYSRDAIVRGLAIFRAKLELGTVPAEEADYGRYLGGIIRHQDTRMELELTSQYLLEQRLRLQDLSLRPLQRTADQIRATTPQSELPQAFLDHALKAEFAVDFRFWGQAAASALLELPHAWRGTLYTFLSRRIAGTFKTDYKRRQDLLDWLATTVAAEAG
jgi:hypothetical protein